MLERTLPSIILEYILYPQECLTKDTLPTGMLEHDNKLLFTHILYPQELWSTYFTLKNSGVHTLPTRMSDEGYITRRNVGA